MAKFSCKKHKKRKKIGNGRKKMVLFKKLKRRNQNFVKFITLILVKFCGIVENLGIIWESYKKILEFLR